MKTTLQFQKDLDKNNDRQWFQQNKDRYNESEAEFRDLVKKIESEMATHDVLDTTNTKIFRIYRDVRFSNNKTPYTRHRSVSFKRAGAERRGGYYLRIEPGETMIAGGFWNPDPKDMLHIRKQLQADPESFRSIFSKKDYSEYFSGLYGEQVKTAPKGFTSDDPAIDLLRYKQFLVVHAFSDQEVLSPDFAKMVSEGFRKMRPFFDHMTEILTTDLNGQSLL